MTRRLRLLLAAAAAFIALGPAPALAGCGDDPAPCEVETGSYHLALPRDGATGPDTGPMPVVVFLHGYGSSGAAMLRAPAVAAPLLDRGYAVIAPNGQAAPGGSTTRWNFHPDFGRGRDELAFLTDVVEDAARRFGLDRSRAILGGFSIGGSMASYIACDAPETFAAYVPVSGSFWRPHPETCAGPVRLLHTHGWRDGTVPLEGRPLRGGEILQGDVFVAMQIWRRANGCDRLRADSFATAGSFWRRAWTQCAPGTALEFALFDGGHTVPDGWADMAVTWFEGLALPDAGH